MLRVFLLALFLLTYAVADDFTFGDPIETNTSVVKKELQKVLYLSYQDKPARVINGQIFSVTLKTVATTTDFDDIEYELLNYSGVEPLNDAQPVRTIDSRYYYDTFYFLATSKYIRLPDFQATLVTSYDNNFKETVLKGDKIRAISLNPRQDFSNIIADYFELSEYKTTSFDRTHNIVVFVATAQNCDIKSFHVNHVFKQGIESINESIYESKLIYYVIIDKKIENFTFSYFNLQKNKFVPITIPIFVQDDSVTTQSDLKPKDQSKEQLKMIIAALVAVVAFLFILWRRKYIYLIFILIPLVYIIYLSIPTKDICLKASSNIYLLPMENGTIFEQTKQRIYLEKEGSTKGYTKVKLKNNKIGWIKNEDICSH